MSTRQAKKIVKEYAQKLRKNCINFQRVYLYGSYASGKAGKHSDIDIAVIVKKAGRGRKYLDNKTRLWRITPEVDHRIEPILLEESELKAGQESILGSEVKKRGIRVV